MSSKHFGELVPKLPKTCSSRFLAKRSWKKLKPAMLKITFTSGVDKKDFHHVVEIYNQTMLADEDDYQPHQLYSQNININQILLPHQIYSQRININSQVLLPHQICN
ncbi:hypothetical protein LIER_15031 [Lithospermum erythrorhizon]|uniref:Uncharacterized protein n=1 Tax=Lithospermum erythrorhizon TaxID=34254 RepID=A0AAV3Q3Q8_LITER